MKKLLPRIRNPKYSATYCSLYHNLASNAPSFDSHHIASHPTQDHARFIATELSNCADVRQLNEIYAHIVRTHFLESFPAPFYWNGIIRSYTRLDLPARARNVFATMLRACVMPDTYTLPIVIKAVCHAFGMTMDRQLHAVAMKHGLQTDTFTESGLISLYAKAGEYDNARKLFEENSDRKLGSWNAIIGGLSQGGRSREAISIFLELMKEGFEPDDVTMVSAISACGSLGNLSLALQLHKCALQAKRFGRSDLLMMNSLIDMYGKCGRMDLANKVFSRMDEKNVSSWTSIIVGYALNGLVNGALESFIRMRDGDVRPNHVTFVGVLSACVHGGRVKEGKYYFNMMRNEYGILPNLQHYGCMVDLLGRAGLLEEAREVINGMPMKANAVIWGCLMGACEKYGNVEIGEWVAKHLQELEPWNDGVYVVLSNIYADNGLWKEVERVRGIMKDRKLAKVPGYSLSTNFRL